MLLMLETAQDYCRKFLGEQRGYSITHLFVLRGSSASEEIIVRKCLQACSFPYREASTLLRIIVYEIVPVLCDVRSDGGGAF